VHTAPGHIVRGFVFCMLCSERCGLAVAGEGERFDLPSCMELGRKACARQVRAATAEPLGVDTEYR
jgi:hypothetical protein